MAERATSKPACVFTLLLLSTRNSV